MDTRTRRADPVPKVALAMGEVVESSTTLLRAVARVQFEAPAFGAVVRCPWQSRVAYAVVSQVRHAPIDPSRRAIPLGRPWEELVREHPQIRELIHTEFDAVIVAHAESGGPVRSWLPPVPPRVHDFVYECASAEIVALTADLSFVRTLASAPIQPMDELVAAAIRQAAAAHADPRAFLILAGREVADLYRQDYERARSVLRRIGGEVVSGGS